MTNPLRQFYIFYCLIFLIAMTSCSSKGQDLLRRTQFIMGTLVEITVRDADADKAQRAIDQAFAEMRRLEKLMSTHLPDSEISRLNNTEGEIYFFPFLMPSSKS